MTIQNFIRVLTNGEQINGGSVLIDEVDKEQLSIYTSSLQREGDVFLFLGRTGAGKFLFFCNTGDSDDPVSGQFESVSHDDPLLVKCPMNHHNAEMLRKHFPFTRPVLIGIDDSIGLGDRLGIANAGHLRALGAGSMKAVLAQQSIRELERTNRKPEEVLDAASWAVFQEGYTEGFGADADHLKTVDHIDLMVRAGYTMLTIDPSEYVINEASGYGKDELLKRSAELPWKDLQSSQDRFISAYNGKTFFISDDFHIKPTESEVLQALVKYGGVVAHTSRLHNHLKSNWPDHPVEIELSIDETDSPTTLFEHYMIVSELKRLGIALTGIAPRFVGDFEKGIDYKGDPGHFKDEYVRHLGIANKLGPYKISIHSGSDKFGVYEVIGSLKQGHVHVKTAGTSYLEALRTVAAADPGLFGEILDFSRAKFKTDRQTYHISADLTKVPEAGRCSTTELFGLLDQDDARQVLHVTFGSVLTERDHHGELRFKDRLMHMLNENEDAHYHNLETHLRRHIQPFAS